MSINTSNPRNTSKKQADCICSRNGHNNSGPEFWRLNSGFWRLNSGFWRLNSGFWRLASEFWRLNSGFWRLNSGFWRLASEFWRLNSGFWRLASEFWRRIYGCGWNLYYTGVRSCSLFVFAGVSGQIYVKIVLQKRPFTIKVVYYVPTHRGILCD